jgi:hypothetical protein
MHYDYEVFREALAARIKALREAKGWTQMHMTTDFGYHVSFYLSGKALKWAGKCRSKPCCASPTLFNLTVEEPLQSIMRRKGPGFGSHGYYREHPSEDD